MCTKIQREAAIGAQHVLKIMIRREISILCFKDKITPASKLSDDGVFLLSVLIYIENHLIELA